MKSFEQKLIQLIIQHQYMYILFVSGINTYGYFIYKFMKLPNSYLDVFILLLWGILLSFVPYLIYDHIRKYTDGERPTVHQYGGDSNVLLAQIFVVVPFFGIFVMLYLSYIEAKKLKLILEKYNGEFILPAERYVIEQAEKS